MRIVSSLYTDVCTNGSLPGNFICRNMAAPRIRLTVGIADEAVWRTLARDSDELQIHRNDVQIAVTWTFWVIKWVEKIKGGHFG